MDTFKITVVFKDYRSIEVKTLSKKDPRISFANAWKEYKEEGAMAIGDYIIDINSVLYIKVEGEKIVEKCPRKKLQNTRKKK